MKVKLLKRYRQQAATNLKFIGGWSGYYKTTIDGVVYRSQKICGLNYLLDQTGDFIPNCIIDRVKQYRNNTKNNCFIKF